MSFPSLWLAALFAAFSAAGVAAKCARHRSYAVLKGIPVIMLICWIGFSFSRSAGILQLLVFAGVLLGLAGDLFLLKPERFFLHGLAAFLAGHIAYCAGFISAGRFLSPLSFCAAVPCVVYFVILVKRMKAESRKKFLPAIAAYLCVIFCMTAAAFSYDLRTGSLSWFSLGAAVFCFSDAVLAWTLFVRRTVFLDGAVLASYYFAQAVIVVAASMAG